MSQRKTMINTDELCRLLDSAKEGYAKYFEKKVCVVAVKNGVKLNFENANSEKTQESCHLPHSSLAMIGSARIDSVTFALLVNHNLDRNAYSEFAELLAHLGTVLTCNWPSFLEKQPLSSAALSLASLIVAPAVGELVKQDPVSYRNYQPWQAIILLITELIRQQRIADGDDNELDELKQIYLKWLARPSGINRRNFDGYDRMNTLARKRKWKISELKQKLQID
jgi:hypothetical protein